MSGPTGRGARRGALLVVVVVAAMAGLACAPAPGTTMFDGGTYAIDVDVPPQTFTSEFPILGGLLGTCTSTTTTPALRVHGTATLAPAAIDPGLTSVTIPRATVVLPRTTVSAGALSLECWGLQLGTVGFSLDFDGTASVQSARLDLTTNAVTLADPTISITDATVTFAGAPEGTPPVPLDPFTVTVPTFDVAL